MYNKILVAVDGSEPSNKALHHAVELAEKLGSKIWLIHAYSVVVPLIPATEALPSPTPIPAASPALAAKMTDDARALGNKILNEAELVVKEHGIQVEKILNEGDVVRAIVSEAEKGQFDLIIVGHRGMSKLGELFLGTVSEGVSHKAPCPVLIVK
jgi:nucleotide-binding universal stress UspA family protein